MKKIFILIFILIFPFVLNAKILKVVCTTVEIADIVKNIGREKVEVIWLMDGRQDPHSVEPRPSMVIKARNADAIAVIGMDLDMWVDGIIRASKNPKIQKGAQGYIDLSVNIKKLEVPQGKVDGRMGDVHIYGNPHYHLDPANGIVMAETIKEKFISLSPDDAMFFQTNYTLYLREIEARITQWKKRMAVFKDISILPTHNCWLYFITAFGLKTPGYLETKPGIPPSPKDIVSLADKMKKENTRLIIAEPFYSSGAIEKISEMTGAKIVRIPSSALGTEEPNTYIGLFEYNISKLENAVK